MRRLVGVIWTAPWRVGWSQAPAAKTVVERGDHRGVQLQNGIPGKKIVMQRIQYVFEEESVKSQRARGRRYRLNVVLGSLAYPFGKIWFSGLSSVSRTVLGR